MIESMISICTADKYWVGLSKEEKAFVGYARLMRKIDNMSSNMFRWILHTINHISLFYDHWYFVSKIVLTLCEKNIGVVIEKNFWNSRLKAKNLQKKFQITRTIYSDSERSEQFLVTECFFNLFLKGSQIW